MTVLTSRLASLRERRTRPISRAQRETRSFYFFISPWIFGFTVFTLFPLLVSFLTSFSNFDGYLNNVKWTGLSNYARVFADADALWGLKRTALYVAIGVPLGMSISFCFALLLNQNIRGRGVFGALFYIPTVIPGVASAWIWRMMMDRNSGLVNALLSLSRPGTAIPWLQTYSFQTLIIMSLWGMGGGIIIYLAALQSVPHELEEAAMIDGASKLQMFRYVTIPLVTPVIFLQLVMGIIGGLQVFQMPLLLSTTTVGSGLSQLPARSIYMFMIHAMRQVMVYGRYAYGAAILWLFFLLILALTLVVFWTQRYWVYYQVEQERRENA
jgi:multiple sugar transport system permease protein